MTAFDRIFENAFQLDPGEPLPVEESEATQPANVRSLGEMRGDDTDPPAESRYFDPEIALISQPLVEGPEEETVDAVVETMMVYLHSPTPIGYPHTDVNGAACAWNYEWQAAIPLGDDVHWTRDTSGVSGATSGYPTYIQNLHELTSGGGTIALGVIANSILNVQRVLQDITSKPPSNDVDPPWTFEPCFPARIWRDTNAARHDRRTGRLLL